MKIFKKTQLLYTFLLLAILVIRGPVASATHIVGGEITYTCLGGNNYQVTVSIYRDCLGGIAGAIEEDNPAFISIFTLNGIRVLTDSIRSGQNTGEIVPPNFKNDCVNNPPKTCLNRIVFQKTYTLDNTATGYKIVYQRCCRNGSILNIVDPSSTGATYSCTIPAATAAPCNNSAVFKNFPPQIICVNNPLIYDHSAIDPDGDSLTYEFCRAYDGGTNTNPKPFPTSISGEAITYRSPYTFGRPMGGNPRIQIDPKSGLITGTPNLQGRFVVSVCCNEWRNGVIINTVTREFQFVVTNCSKAVVANIPQFSNEFNTYIVNCKDYTVDFVNLSTGGSSYHWDFGVPGVINDTSNEFQPTFIYPDSGTYVVTLYVNKGSSCSDSISRFVKIYPILKANFSAMTPVCPGDTVDFTDLTFSSFQINSWQWNFDDFTDLNYTQNPKHAFIHGGLYNVGLQVKNQQGCVDTLFKKILVDPFKPNIGKDTTIVKGERIYFKGNGGTDYIWTPPTYLSNPNISNPVGYFTDTGTFVYSVIVKSTQTNCIGRDTIVVRVLNNGYLTVPNAFTPNGDGKNDKFRPLLVGYQSIQFFRIYNRYGQEVYNSQNIEEGWDGTFKGKEMEMGVYYWLLNARDRFGKEVQQKGDVTLIR